ncbi:hypothetical protein MMC17_007697 [Xylographa soralifera]|nr:hypothetical protein [Xylographa soralifera]
MAGVQNRVIFTRAWKKTEIGEILHEQYRNRLTSSSSFTMETLHTSITRIHNALSREDDTHIAVPQLGLSAFGMYPSSSAYGRKVRNPLQTLPRAAADRGRPVSVVVLLGESVGNEEFIMALKDALRI